MGIGVDAAGAGGAGVGARMGAAGALGVNPAGVPGVAGFGTAFTLPRARGSAAGGTGAADRVPRGWALRGDFDGSALRAKPCPRLPKGLAMSSGTSTCLRDCRVRSAGPTLLTTSARGRVTMVKSLSVAGKKESGAQLRMSPKVTLTV